MGKSLIIKGADFSANAFQFTYFIMLNANVSALGTVSGSGSYERGTVITASATPKGSARFVTWSDGNMNANRQITVDENVTLTAYFTDTQIVSGLVFDGSAYIDLGMKLNSRCNFEIDMSTPYDATGAWIFGAMKNSSGYAFLKSSASGRYRWQVLSQHNEFNNNTDFSQRCTLLLKNDGHLYKDSQEIYYIRDSMPSFITENNAFLGAMSNDGTPDPAYFRGNMYSFKIISENGNVLLHMIPSNDNGTYCFYDVISRQYYAPETGSLTPVSE